MIERSWRIRAAISTAVVCGVMLPAVARAQSEPGEVVGQKIPVPGTQVEGTTAKLSEVEAEMVARLPPQSQAERLLQYAISHHAGATDEIRERVRAWRGAISRTSSLDTLMEVALNGNDLRVRAAALEIELAARGIARNTQQVDLLLQQIAASPKDSLEQIWVLGLLANRGIETARIHNELRALMEASDEDVRYWAVAAISYIGTDQTVPDLVRAFRYDSSFHVRIDGGGCGLAHCGMLTRAQRMISIPALIDMVEDRALDSRTVLYGYRALREITDETLPDSPDQWREWYAAHGAETTDRFRRFPDNDVRK